MIKTKYGMANAGMFWCEYIKAQRESVGLFIVEKRTNQEAGL